MARREDVRRHPGAPDRPGEDRDAALEAARAALELGVRTIADPTVMFIGRDVAFMRDVSERTGLQVVAATGIYTYDYLHLLLRHARRRQIADLFVSDIEQGSRAPRSRARSSSAPPMSPG